MAAIIVIERMCRIMKLKKLIIVLILLLCGSFVGCSTDDEINGNLIGKPIGNVLAEPDRIIIYSKGTAVKKLDKNSSELKKLVNLTSSRFHSKLSTAKDIINEDIMTRKKADGLGIEFIYSREQYMDLKGYNYGFVPFKYYRLYFQITSKTYGNSPSSDVHTFQHGDKYRYSEYSRGSLKYSDELVQEVENLAKENSTARKK